MFSINQMVKVKRSVFIRASEKQGHIIGIDITPATFDPDRIVHIFIVSFQDIPMSHDPETSPYRYFEDELTAISGV